MSLTVIALSGTLRAATAVRVTRRAIPVLFVATALSLGAVAFAFWSTAGVGSSVASTGTLNAPTNLVVSAPVDSGTVAVSWDGASLGTGHSAEGYYVTRVRHSDGATNPACGTSISSPTPNLSCDDVSIADGTYHYTVTALIGSWTAESAASASVTVVNDSGRPTVTVTSISPTPNANGYNQTSPVVVNLSASDDSGIASITYRVDSGTPVTVAASTR